MFTSKTIYDNRLILFTFTSMATHRRRARAFRAFSRALSCTGDRKIEKKKQKKRKKIDKKEGKIEKRRERSEKIAEI